MEKLKLIEGLGGEYLAEEIIKRSKDSNIIYLTEDILLNTKCVQELARYLENLIQENKELKEQNIELLTRLKADGLIERDKYWISKIKEALYKGTLDAKGWGCEDGAYCVEKQFKQLLEEGE